MADEADTQAAQAASVEETTADSQSDTQTQDSNVTSTEGAGESTASTGDTKPSQETDVKDSKPVSRRSAAYRIQQLVNENNQLRQQQKPVQQDEENTAQDDKPDIAAIVAREVEKRLNPIVSESSKTADEAELSELFTGDKAAERTKYESRIRELWKLPQYKDVAASDLYKIASFDEAVASATARAIEEYKKAEKEARESSTSGSNTSNRTGKSGKSISDMTDEEFAAHNARVKAGLAK